MPGRIAKALKVRTGALRSVGKEVVMAKGQVKSNKEVRKPKAQKVKTNASQPSTKDRPVGIVTVKS